ncbi:UNVERIFIED_CONTAM: hypothetical protein K2H54_062072 [Gekko kuhli]
MAAELGEVSALGLRFLDSGLQAEANVGEAAILKMGLERAGGGPCVVPAGGPFEQCLRWGPPQMVKKEPGEGLVLPRWEAQWQEFLRTVQAPQSGCGYSAQLTEATQWGDTKTSLGLFEGLAVTSTQWLTEEGVARSLLGMNGGAHWAGGELDAVEERGSGQLKKVPGKLFQDWAVNFPLEEGISSETARTQTSREVKREGEGVGHALTGGGWPIGNVEEQREIEEIKHCMLGENNGNPEERAWQGGAMGEQMSENEEVIDLKSPEPVDLCEPLLETAEDLSGFPGMGGIYGIQHRPEGPPDLIPGTGPCSALERYLDCTSDYQLGPG